MKDSQTNAAPDEPGCHVQTNDIHPQNDKPTTADCTAKNASVAGGHGSANESTTADRTVYGKPSDGNGRSDSGTSRTLGVLESLAVFALGAAMMTFAYGGHIGKAGGDPGVPGHDSFYHIKMAELLPEVGIMRTFPWLHFTYFTDTGSAFVSHHFGFHVLLAPFVRVSHWLTGDYLPGGRWATATFFGLVAMLFHRLLVGERIRWRGLWLLLFFFLPIQFFTRHAFVRAISPSLVFLLLVMLLMFARRFRWAGLAVAGYTHLYLGGVLFAPVVVGAYAFSLAVGSERERRLFWPLVGWTLAGWLVGVVTYPYAGGTFEFLKLQVFGSGLSPDISVGREWKPYEGLWWFANLCGVVLTVWVVALVARLRAGPALHARELALVLLHFGFLVLTFKARRFIEYWPILGLLSAAFLARPVLDRLAGACDRILTRRGWWRDRWLIGAAMMASATGVAVVVWMARRNTDMSDLLFYWPAWGLAIAVYVGVSAMRVRRTGVATATGRVLTPTVCVIAAGVMLTSTALTLGASSWAAIREGNRCMYDLPEIRKMMAFLKDRSKPGDVVFTDDWDVFPVYFYHNSKNHYIVGLDPEFTHHRRPDLWQRYVKISRGKVPTDTSYVPAEAAKHGRKETKPIHVRLDDIKTYFGARFVITDRDHQALAGKLARAKRLAELIYPSTSYAQAKNKPYLIFRILDSGEMPATDGASASVPSGNRAFYLSRLTPVYAEQGWGDLVADRSVGGGVIRLGSKTYQRGLGTHAPSKLVYELPQGYGSFRAMVGVDAVNGGRGRVMVSVSLDGDVVFRSPVLSGSSDPISVCVPVKAARRLILKAGPTPDGKRFDHVDWADARLDANAICDDADQDTRTIKR